MSVPPQAANAILDQLAADRRPTAVVTNSPRDVATEILEHANFRVGRLVSGTDVPSPKPAPDVLLLACEQLEVSPGEAWMVGDTEYDRRAASGAAAAYGSTSGRAAHGAKRLRGRVGGSGLGA